MLLLLRFPLPIRLLEFLQSFSHFGRIIGKSLLYQLAELCTGDFVSMPRM